MAKANVTLSGLGSPPPTEPPKREPIPVGQYLAMIVGVKDGFTNSTPPLDKVTVEYQILHAVLADGKTDEKHKGRRLWQDYIYKHDPSVDDNFNAQRLYDLKMMLLATETPHDETGFDTDDIGKKNNMVYVWVTHRNKTVDDGVDSDGKKKTRTMTFTNVQKIDTAKAVDAESLV
jgi:hypothetical protein